MKQLKTRQICLFFIAFMPITKLFMLPSVVAEIASEDMWISAVFNLLVDMLTLAVILWVCRKCDCDFFELLEKSFGKTVAKIILFVFAIYFFSKAFIPLQEQKEFVKLSLYINLPTDLFFLPFFLVSFYLCLKPLRIFGRIADILWLFTIVGYLLLIVLSVNNVDWAALLPIGARGIKSVAEGSYHSVNWWGDCAYALFFIGNFAHGKKASVKILLSYLIGGIIVIIAFIFFWGTFTSIAFRQKFAMTELSKYTTVINNTGRFDYVGILFILFSCVFGLAIPLYLTCNILQRIFPLKRTWIIPLCVNLLMAILLIALNQYMVTLTQFFSNVMGVFFIIMGNLLPLLTVCLIPARRKYEKNFNT